VTDYFNAHARIACNLALSFRMIKQEAQNNKTIVVYHISPCRTHHTSEKMVSDSLEKFLLRHFHGSFYVKHVCFELIMNDCVKQLFKY
jgi:hypothetical protein